MWSDYTDGRFDKRIASGLSMFLTSVLDAENRSGTSLHGLAVIGGPLVSMGGWTSCVALFGYVRGTVIVATSIKMLDNDDRIVIGLIPKEEMKAVC